MNKIAEVLLKLAFHLSSTDQIGYNIRWTIMQYFQRFKHCPAPTKITTVEEYSYLPVAKPANIRT